MDVDTTTTQDLPGVPGYSGDKAALLARLRRIEGQVRGVQRMVDEDFEGVVTLGMRGNGDVSLPDGDGIEVLTQISAATRALQAVAMGLLEDHLSHCVVDAARTGDPSAKVREAADAIARLVRA